MKISVIMASFLGMPGRQNMDLKFKRAVNSFINQTYEDKELIIVSDGCEITNQIYNNEFSKINNIHLIPIPKQPLYSGIMRNIAFDVAEGDIITYLDADDCIKNTHLQYVYENFDMENVDWMYGDDLMVLNKEFSKFHVRVVDPRYGSIGTSSIVHKHPRLLKNGEWLRWSSGYGHDFCFTLKLASLGYKFKKFDKTLGYIVCHYRDMDA